MKPNAALEAVGVACSLSDAESGLCRRSQSVRCCDVMSETLPGKVFMPETSIYNARIESIFSITAALEPWCLVMPDTTNDVSKFMDVIKQENCPFGIRSGGHAVYALGNSVEDGITIDLGNMNTTVYHEDTDTVTIEPGARWGAVYETLAEDGVAVVGGRVTGVGVGGLVLGGGNSLHSGKYGFACDNVLTYEIVLANGTVVLAKEDSHPKLFRSLCGGSGNFGIVTEFEMKAVPLAGGEERPHIWGGASQRLYDNLEVIDELVDFTERAEEDVSCSALCAWVWAPTQNALPLVNACLVHNVDDKENATLFKGLMDVPGSLGNTYRSAPMVSFATEIGRLAQHQKQNIWGSSSFRADPKVMRFVVEEHKKLTTELARLLADDPSPSSLLIFQPLTLPMLAHGAGKNVLGLEEDSKDGPGMFTLIIVQASTQAGADSVLPLVRAFEKSIDDYAKEAGSYWKWTYLNYVDFFRDPIASYGADSVKFLKEVAAEYDPEKIFQKLRKSGHKLPTKV